MLFSSIVFTSNGGTGARPELDGLSATAYPSGVKGTPVEVAESLAPVIFWRKDLRDGSGGEGQTRGGDGQIIEISSRIDQPFDILAAFDRIDFPPLGANGGENGKSGEITLKTGEKLRGKGRQTITSGERLIIKTPGGGGLGEKK